MSFELGTFIGGKLAGVVAALSKAALKNSDEVVALLKTLGYERLSEDFETLYVHTLAYRRLDEDPVPLPLLALFKKLEVVEAFHRAWEEGEVKSFDKETRWAVEAFREGDEVRGLNVDVEQEVRKFYETFDKLVKKARTPGDKRLDRLVEEIPEKVAQKLSKLILVPSESEHFQRNLTEWLEACGYVIEEPPESTDKDGPFDLVASMRRGRRGTERYLIQGFHGVVTAGHFHDLPDPRTRGAKESWLISSVEVTRPARKAARKAGGKRDVLTFDDLIDDVVRFDKYEAYLKEEFGRRKLDKYYVPMACHKPEFDAKGVLRGEEHHEVLEDYAEWWLEQPIREHISILGEFGTGKTWFTLRLAYDRMQAYHAARRKNRPRGRYPLLIQLRDYAKAVSVHSLLSEFFFDRFEVGLPSMKAFNVLNRMGRFLLIFDGFDEMARKVDYQKVVDNFWELAKVVVPGAKAVLTCRDEHFRYAQEAREVLAGNEMASTSIVLTPPRFDVVHLEPFDESRIRKAIISRQGKKTGKQTADLVLAHRSLADLVKRPVMIEMVLDSLDDIKGRDTVLTSQIYLFATDSQMRKNITEERTFTSMTEKVLFLCELAWEMHRTENLKLNYRLFPERIKEIFGDRVKEAEMDHWRFDLAGQTLLVRDAEGNYSFAHRGLVEYFSAYRLLAQVDALAPEFAARYREDCDEASAVKALQQRTSADPHAAWGAAPFHPNLVAFLAEMASGTDPLMRLIQWTQGKDEEQAGYAGGNAATILARIDAHALEGADISGASLRQARLPGIRLHGVCATDVDLRNADLMASDLSKGNFRNAKLEGAKLTGLVGNCATACDPTGELLFGGTNDGGWVYDLRIRGFLDIYGATGGILTCDRAVSGDAKWLVHANNERIRVGAVDREAGAIQWAFLPWPGGKARRPRVAWHPEGWFLVVNSELGVLRVDPGPPPTVRPLEPMPFEITGIGSGVAISPPLWLIGDSSSTTVWHEKDRRVVASLDAKAIYGERPELSPAGNRVSIATSDGLHIFETTHWQRVGHLEEDSSCTTHGWSPTGGRVAFCDRRKKEVLVVDAGDFSIQARLKLPSGPLGVAFHGTGELVVVDTKATIHLYDLGSGELIHSAPQMPLCEGADLRGATGLDEATLEALNKAGAQV